MVDLLTQLPETFVDIEDGKGNNPLHYAAQTGNIKICQYLCKTREANPLLTNFQRQLPRDMTTDTTLKAYLEEQEEKFKAKHGHSFV